MTQLYPFYSRPMMLFQAIYEAGNLHRAAEDVGLTQPALTKRVQQLEGYFGVKLFDRAPHGMVPTDAGHALYRYTCHLKKSAEYARFEIQGFATGQSGALRVGAGVTWVVTVMPTVMSSLHHEFPNLTLDLVTGTAEQLWSLLETGRVDMVIAAGGPIRPPEDPEIATIAVADMPLTAVASADHALTQGPTVKLEQTLEYNWAGYYEDDAYHKRVQHFFDDYRLPSPKFTLSSNSFSALMQMVRLSGTIAIISDILVEQAEQHGNGRIPLDRPLWSLRMNVFVRRSALSLSSIQRCIELSKQVIGKHGSSALIAYDQP